MNNGLTVTTMNTFPYIELHNAILTFQASLYVLFSATCQLSNDSIVERRNATRRLLFWAPGCAICRPEILKALLSLSSYHTRTRLKSSNSNSYGLQCQSEARFLVDSRMHATWRQRAGTEAHQAVLRFCVTYSSKSQRRIPKDSSYMMERRQAACNKYDASKSRLI